MAILNFLSMQAESIWKNIKCRLKEEKWDDIK